MPLTIGLTALVAVMQTAWHRTGNPKYLGMTRFWGRIMLINFAMGVVTGIVQEFQFGMAWSEYSRFVGEVLGNSKLLATFPHTVAGAFAVTGSAWRLSRPGKDTESMRTP